MNLSGLMPRSMYAVDVLWPQGHYGDVLNGDKVYDTLLQMRRCLERDGFSIEGSLRDGFTATKNDTTVKIVLENL